MRIVDTDSGDKCSKAERHVDALAGSPKQSSAAGSYDEWALEADGKPDNGIVPDHEHPRNGVCHLREFRLGL